MDFSGRLKQLRKEEDITQEDLAFQLDISKSSIAMYETGKRVPEVATLEAIADYFNVDMDYLMGKTNVRSRESYENTYADGGSRSKDIGGLLGNVHRRPTDGHFLQMQHYLRLKAYHEQFEKLDKEDQQEIMDIIEMKLKKAKYQ